MKKEYIYLDNAANTQICSEALNKLNECLKSEARNAGSLHYAGRESASYLEEARDIIAASLNVMPREIVFTSGGTEADNMAILGFARANKHKGNHIISTAVEHPAVLNSLEKLKNEGFEITLVNVDEKGQIDLNDISDAIKDNTILISVMHVNNETGAIYDIDAVSDIANKAGVAFHTDCVQSYTKLPINPKASGISMLSASSHKIHGPLGAGFLYVSEKTMVEPLIYGGHQESSLRAGTVAVPLIAAMAEAVKTALEITDEQKLKIKILRDKLIYGITEENTGAALIGSMDRRIYDNASISFANVTADSLLYALDCEGLCVSAGSACEAGSLEISHVIKAMGLEGAGAPVRFSLSRFTTEEEIKDAINIVSKVYKRLTGSKI